MLAEIMGIKVIEFREEKPFNHYITTPYTAESEPAIRFIPKTQVDFGEGLLEVIGEVKKQR